MTIKEKIHNLKINILRNLTFFKIGIVNSIEYKLFLLYKILDPVIEILILSIIWNYLYTFNYGSIISFMKGMSYIELMTYYIIMKFLNNIKLSKISEKIEVKILSGDISSFLSKPVKFTTIIFYEALGRSVIGVVFLILLIIILLFVKQIQNPSNIYLLYFFIYLILVIIFYSILYIIIGGLSFFTGEIWGFLYIFHFILFFLSGSLIPLSVFPEKVITILKYTPFLYLDWMLVNIYLEKITVAQIFNNAIILIVWNIIFFLIMKFIYRKGFKKLVSYGG